jgi:hypothetical protein
MVDQWTEHAACRDAPADDVELGFGIDQQQRAFADGYCARCPVVADCAEHAWANDEREGVWGGLTETQRQHQRRRRTA